MSPHADEVTSTEAKTLTLAEGEDDGGAADTLTLAPTLEPNTTKVDEAMLVDIIQVAERDQKWNKAPSPKHWVTPLPAHYGYDDDAKEGSTVLTRTVFVAVEPGSNKVELDVKCSTHGGSGGIPTLVGIKSQSGTILSDVATIGSDGVAHLDFTPAHGINDGRHEICIGVDKNANGKLDADEVVAFPLDKKFWIRAVSKDDYDREMFHLQWYVEWGQGLGYTISASFVRYFDSTDGTLMDSTSSTLVSFPITKTDLTLIAGSTYAPITGTTQVTKFKLPSTSIAATKIGKTLNYTGSKGMRGVVHETWSKNEATLKAPFENDPTLQTWTSPPIQVSVASGSIQLDGAGIDDDLTYSFGTAGISGTLTFKLKRDPTNPKKVLIDELDTDCVVEDLYDFDWTRGATSESRHASIVQIGWQPSAREGGRIFVTSVDIKEHYTTGTFTSTGVDKFNDSWPLTLK